MSQIEQFRTLLGVITPDDLTLSDRQLLLDLVSRCLNPENGGGGGRYSPSALNRPA